MFKNNNSGVIARLAKSSLKSSKMRNFFIILTIALSVSLLTGIALFFMGMNEKEMRQLETMQHVIYHDITQEQIAGLESNSQVADIRLFKSGKSSEIENYIVSPMYLEQKKTGMAITEVTKGNYPKALDEIAVDLSYMKQIGREAVLGEKLSFTFLDGVTEEFVISGFTDTKMVSTVYTLMLSKEYAEKGSQLKDELYSAPVQIKDAKAMSEETFFSTIREMGSENNIPRSNINENNAFVLTLSVSGEMTLTIVVAILAILFVSILVIYSVFYISVVSRIQQFGQLRTLGATQKQLKNMVRREGISLCLRGAPIGLAIGGIFAYVIMPEGFSWLNTILIFIFALIADLITVLISIQKPAKVAASVSPIEASKAMGGEISSKKGETQKLHRKLTPFTLASMNSKRNRKKTILTAISLGVGGVLFISGATMLTSMNRQEYSRQGVFKNAEYNIYFSENAAQTNEMGYTGIQINNPINDKLISDIKGVEHVKDVTTTKSLAVTFDYNVIHNDDEVMSFGRESDSIMKKIINEGSYDYDNMVANREVLIDHNDIAKEIFGWRFEVGDKVKLSWFNGKDTVEEEFTIAGGVDDSMEKVGLFSSSGWFLVPEDLLATMVQDGFNLNNTASVKIDDFDKNGDQVEQQLRAIVEESPQLNMSSLKDRIAQDVNIYNTLLGTVVGFTAFIIGFSLINLVNTLITNVLTRKKEFAMLQSIGMERRQLTKMIQIEGLIIAAKNILITIVIGSICGAILVAIMQSFGATYMHFSFPIWYALVYFVIIVAAPIVISYLAIKSFVNKSLVERLKDNS